MLDPAPRYLLCLSQLNHAYRVAQRADMVAVHFPERSNRRLAELFGAETGDAVDKFSRCRWEPGPAGTPLLLDCPHRLVGRVVDRIDVDDHTAYVLDVVEASAEGRTLDLLTLSAGAGSQRWPLRLSTGGNEKI